VRSWRHGSSLGIDPILVDSICSFNCVYCQLGSIHQVVDEQRFFVPTERVVAELATRDLSGVDIATFSGSGEPTLALNLGELVDHVRFVLGKPVLVLTNSTWLHDHDTRGRLRHASIVDCKLDAASDAMLRKFNRPAAGVTLARILDGIRALRRDPRFEGKLTIQTMFMPANANEAAAVADLLADIAPDEIHLNTPRRAYPRAWYLGARGNHGTAEAPVETATLATISPDRAQEIEAILRERTNAVVHSVYRS